MKKMTLKTLVAAPLLSILLAFSANASLLTNGDFESPGIASGWTFATPGADGWQGDNIEVWASGFNGVTSYEGTQHGELNAHPYDGTVFSIYQTFATTLNFWYDYSLAYRARSSSNESFRLEIFTGDLINRDSIVNMIFDDHVTTEWSTFAGGFTGSGEKTYIMLTSVNPDTGTVGNFIDAVVVNEVSEPTALMLLGLGLAGLAFVRRRA